MPTLTPETRLDTDQPAGGFQTSAPVIARSGTYAYVAYEDLRNNVSEVYVRGSNDGGATWTGPEWPMQILVPGTSRAIAPSVAASGATAYCVWQDARNGNFDDIYFRTTSDGGLTWPPQKEVRLDTDFPGTGQSVMPHVVCNGTTVVVVWQDYRNGQADIYMNRSGDGGKTWLLPDVRLDTDAAGAAMSMNPVVAMTGSDVYVAWMDFRSGSPDIRLNRSGDGGVTWLAADLRLDTDAVGANPSTFPVVTADGAGAVVAWVDNRNGASDVYANASLDHGATWLGADVRLDSDTAGASASTRVTATMTGADVRVAWLDARTAGGDVRLRTSADGGLTWGASDVRVDQRPAGLGNCDMPQVVGDAANVFVTWSDTRSGAADVYFQASLDGGATWMPLEVRLDSGVAGSASSLGPRSACVGRTLRTVWQDSRNGLGDVYVAGSD